MTLPVPIVRRFGARIVGLAIAGSTVVASAPARAQHLATGGSVDVSIVRVIAALLFSLLVGLGLLLVRHRSPGQAGSHRFKAVLSGLRAGRFVGRLVTARRIDVIEARRISPHADMCLVRCDDEEFLILAGAGGTTVLKTMPVAASEARTA